MKNKQGGFDYEDKDSLSRAKEVDLITLPKTVEGTNCGNCKFVKVIDKKQGIGYCTNPEILLPVSSRMCCALWDAKKVLRSWEK